MREVAWKCYGVEGHLSIGKWSFYMDVSTVHTSVYIQEDRKSNEDGEDQENNQESGWAL